MMPGKRLSVRRERPDHFASLQMTTEPEDSGSEHDPVSPESYIAGPWVYVAAAAVYIAIGVFFPWVFTWWRGFLFAMLAVWLIPLLYLRWRK